MYYNYCFSNSSAKYKRRGLFLISLEVRFVLTLIRVGFLVVRFGLDGMGKITPSPPGNLK